MKKYTHTRIEESLYEKIKKEAEKARRTISGQIEHYIVLAMEVEIRDKDRSK